jgi:TAG lipase/steryl ester hydrolase/phospholipase A2/LPA acyltransferase
MPAHPVRDAFRALDAATTYTQWQSAADALDTALGLDAWRDDDTSPTYDADALRRGLHTLTTQRDTEKPWETADRLHALLHRHVPDLLDASLYDTAFGGTKRLVERFYEEIERTIDWLAGLPLDEATAAQRRERFRAQAHAVGGSALMLSGGATLGFHHLGVCKALHQHQLLPKVLAGASMGAMIAAGIANRDDAALDQLFADPSEVATRGLSRGGWSGVRQRRALLDPATLHATILHNVGDGTFAEAFRRTGRVVNISVSPTRRRQKPSVLCHLTAPDVLLASAALASSSVPGLFPPAQLWRRARGREEPYLRDERWIDGSMLSDVPAQRVGRLHNVNHFIVSQTNPHVVPFVRGQQKGVLGFTRRLLARGVHRQGVQAVSALRDVAGTTRIGPAVDVAHALWAQAYGGDIDIVPPVPARAYLRVVSNPTPAELLRYILDGERGTWPTLARIRDATRLSRALDRAIRRVG